MPKIPAAFILFIAAATMIGCTSAPKKSKLNATAKSKQTCLPAKEDTRQSDKHNHKIAIHKHETNRVQTGRYSTVKPGPTLEQTSILDVMITVTIPNDIQSIGETVKYLLRRSGYRMTPEAIQGPETAQFLSKKLPYVHRKIGPMKLIDALNMLTTPAFVLFDNPVRREIGYRVKSKYINEGDTL